MDGGWWIAIIGGLVLVWAIGLDARVGFDAVLARWWVRWARRRGGWAGPLSFLTSIAALGSYGLVILVGDRLGVAMGDARWALVLVLPAMLTYSPFVFATMPTQYGAYAAWRQELAAAGADDRLQRAIAWWAGLPSLAGLVATFAVLFPIFA